MRGKRYPTYLWARGTERQPARMAALAVWPLPHQDGDTGSTRVLRVGKWEMEVWGNRAGRPGKVHHLSGMTGEDWWDSMRSLLSLKGTLTVLCPHAVRALSLLGLWDRIDRREATLDRVPLLLSDPPTSLMIGAAGLPGRLHVLDTRNYGVEIPHNDDACKRAGAFARDMVAGCLSGRMGTLQDTVGAQAMYGYRLSYMGPAGLVHMRERVLALERSALHGGRAECYRLGKVVGPVYALDQTGYYTSIMCDTAVPVRLRHYSEEWFPHGPALLREGVPMIARVKVTTDWPHLPCARDGLVIYPTGTWWTVLCGADLRTAWEHGEVVEGGQWATYDTERALQGFATACLWLREQARQDGKPDAERWAKALGVSMVGKWAQQRRVWRDSPHTEPRYPWGTWHHVGRGGNWTRYRSLGGLVQREEVGGETDTSSPAIAAWIYAEGRRRIWEARLVAGLEEVYYTHTDSLFCSALGHDRLRDAGMVGTGEPGRLRLTAVWDWIEILGISHYRVPGRTVCAGVVGSGQGDVCPSNGRWVSQTAPVALGEHHPPLPVEMRAPGETIRPYRHGERLADGTVRPWRIE